MDLIGVSSCPVFPSCPMRRSLFRTLLLCFLVLLLGAGLGSVPPVFGRLALQSLRFGKPDGACEASRLHRWTALRLGLTVDCPESLLEGPRSLWMLRRLAHDQRASQATRVQAIGALSRGGDPEAEKLLELLVFSVGLSPELRREMWTYAAEQDRVGWSELAVAGGIHGLWARGKSTLFAEGDAALPLLPALQRADPWVRHFTMAGLGVTADLLAKDCERAEKGLLPLDVPADWQSVFLGPTCATGKEPLLLALLEKEGHRRGEEHQSPEPLLLGDSEVDLLFFRNGAAGDLLREEVAASSRWIVSGEQSVRLRAVIAHPRAAVVAEGGDLLGTLWNGAGSPGDTALLGMLVSSQAGLRAHLEADNGGIDLSLDGGSFRVGLVCGNPSPVPPEGALVFGLLNAMGDSFRRRDWEAAAAQGFAAEKLWNGPPGKLAGLLARSLAPLEPVAVSTLLLPPRLLPGPPPPPSRRRKRVIPPPEPHPWAGLRNAAAQRAVELKALADSPLALSLAALWSGSLGDPAHEALSAELLPQTSHPDPAWIAAARALGDPVGEATPSANPCATPFWLRSLQP